MGFADHFSAVASQYALYRPQYPEGLAVYLAQQAPRRVLAWDAGCGTGQFSVSLAKHFAHVHATDASAEQIARAAPAPNIRYEARRCDDSGLEPGTVDLACVAQAAHWFDLPSYYAEVARVAAPHALIALIAYGNLERLGDACL